MYARKKGKAGSHRPISKKAPWVAYKPEEVEKIVAKLAKQGYQSSAIGMILRDTYGVPLSVPATKKKITKIMKERGIQAPVPEDLFNLLKRAVNLQDHMVKNKKDYTSKRGLELTESKIRKLAKYYIRAGKLPESWKYRLDEARLLVK